MDMVGMQGVQNFVADVDAQDDIQLTAPEEGGVLDTMIASSSKAPSASQGGRGGGGAGVSDLRLLGAAAGRTRAGG